MAVYLAVVFGWITIVLYLRACAKRLDIMNKNQMAQMSYMALRDVGIPPAEAVKQALEARDKHF